MITAAVNRLRSFCSSVSISRRTGLVSLQVEKEQFNDISASRYWDRIDRPEQLPASLMKSIQILTDPATTGGGVVYSSASRVLAEFAEKTGIPIGSTQAGKGAIPYDHLMNSGPMGALGLRFANCLAHTADLVIGIGTRYTDFTSASNTMFQNPQVHFVNINVLSFDAHKEAAVPVIGDARETLSELQEVLGDWQVDEDYRREAMAQADEQRQAVRLATRSSTAIPAWAMRFLQPWVCEWLIRAGRSSPSSAMPPSSCTTRMY